MLYHTDENAKCYGNLSWLIIKTFMKNSTHWLYFNRADIMKNCTCFLFFLEQKFIRFSSKIWGNRINRQYLVGSRNFFWAVSLNSAKFVQCTLYNIDQKEEEEEDDDENDDGSEEESDAEHVEEIWTFEFDLSWQRETFQWDHSVLCKFFPIDYFQSIPY